MAHWRPRRRRGRPPPGLSGSARLGMDPSSRAVWRLLLLGLRVGHAWPEQTVALGRRCGPTRPGCGVAVGASAWDALPLPGRCANPQTHPGARRTVWNSRSSGAAWFPFGWNHRLPPLTETGRYLIVVYARLDLGISWGRLMPSKACSAADCLTAGSPAGPHNLPKLGLPPGRPWYWRLHKHRGRTSSHRWRGSPPISCPMAEFRSWPINRR